MGSPTWLFNPLSNLASSPRASFIHLGIEAYNWGVGGQLLQDLGNLPHARLKITRPLGCHYLRLASPHIRCKALARTCGSPGAGNCQFTAKIQSTEVLIQQNSRPILLSSFSSCHRHGGPKTHSCFLRMHLFRSIQKKDCTLNSFQIHAGSTAGAMQMARSQ